MSEGGQAMLNLGACFGWAVYCGVMSHLFRQSRATDSVATFFGCVLIIFFR